MKLLTVVGAPSAGKTSVILHLARVLRECGGLKTGVVKFGTLSERDTALFEKLRIPALSILPAGECGDVCFGRMEEALLWAAGEGVDLLAAELTGLCGRSFAKHRNVPCICVADDPSGNRQSDKLESLMKTADIVAVTKGDAVSKAERSSFEDRIRRANPKAAVVYLNGVTGQGTVSLLRQLRFPELDARRDLCLCSAAREAAEPCCADRETEISSARHLCAACAVESCCF